MIYFGNTELIGLKIGNSDISAVYAGDLLIYPTTVTAWSVSPSQIQISANGGNENIRVASLSSWTISSSESWITFSQNSGDSGRTTVVATIASHQVESARTATITVTDGTNTSTIAVTQEAYNTYRNQYFTMEVLTGGTINWKAGANATRRTIEYSINGGTWTSIEATTAGNTFNVAGGDIIRFRGTNASYCTGSSAGTYTNTFSASTASVKLYGNVMSLIYGDNFQSAETFTGTYVFRSFLGFAGVKDAENLILPATALTEGCYLGMFADTRITVSPELPATTLAKSCYWNMFLRVSTLTTPSVLPATTLAESCYRAMYYQTAIATAPDLPATTLVPYCYQQMFEGCSNLNYIKCLATNISASQSLSSWVSSVSSSGTFVKDASMSSWPSGTSGIPVGWTVINNS